MARWRSSGFSHISYITIRKIYVSGANCFDAAAKCDGISLNDALNAGPKLQCDLVHVLPRFRKNSVAVVCDVPKCISVYN